LLLFTLQSQLLRNTAFHAGSVSCTAQEVRKTGEVPAALLFEIFQDQLERDCRQNLFGVNEKL
jgi:hypothetical protein